MRMKIIKTWAVFLGIINAYGMCMLLSVLSRMMKKDIIIFLIMVNILSFLAFFSWSNSGIKNRSILFFVCISYSFPIIWELVGVMVREVWRGSSGNIEGISFIFLLIMLFLGIMGILSASFFAECIIEGAKDSKRIFLKHIKK